MTATRISRRVNAPRSKVYRAGKTTAHTDTYHGHFIELVPDEKVVEVVEFDAAGGGTEIHAVHDRLPPGLSPADNEAGWRSSLGKLAALVEAES
jgi:uncharacterized protein YndB with AHSA1/START domain